MVVETVLRFGGLVPHVGLACSDAGKELWLHLATDDGRVGACTQLDCFRQSVDSLSLAALHR